MTSLHYPKISIAADFNEFRDSNRLRTLARYIEPHGHEARAGQPVLLYDEEGNAAIGIVERHVGEVIYVRVDWSSWNSYMVKSLREPTQNPIWTEPLSSASSTSIGYDREMANV